MIPTRLQKCVGFLLFFIAVSLTTTFAQGYSLTIHCPTNIAGRFYCTLYSNDSTTTTFRPRINNGEATLTGTLQQPCLMKITHHRISQPLYLYLENANIVVNLNPANPNSSPITGSRTNSRYRYALETNNANTSSNWLSNLIQENASEIYAPFILHQYASTIPFNTLEKLHEQLSGLATTTYHYRQLTSQIQQMQATLEGSTLPDFIFYDTIKHAVHFDSIHSNTNPTIIIFTASWCNNGNAIAKQIQTTYPQLQTVIIPIDAHPKQWDAPYLKQLSVDRIPYMILLNQDKKILTRDARIWELPRLIKHFQLNTPISQSEP